MDGERKGRAAVGKEEKNRNKNENKIIHRDLQSGSVARKESGGAVKGRDRQEKGCTGQEKNNAGQWGENSRLERRNAEPGTEDGRQGKRKGGQDNKSAGRTGIYSANGESGIGIRQLEAGPEKQDVGEKDPGRRLHGRKESIRRQGRTGEGYGEQAEYTADIGDQSIQDFIGGGDMGREPERQSGRQREIREQSVSDFHSTTKIMERAGSAVAQAGRSAVSSLGNEEDAAFAGAKKIGSTAVSVSSVLVHSGANASYNRMRDQALTVADAADALDRAFTEGCVTVGMLEGNRNAVIQSLHQAGMSVPMAKKTARNMEEIREKLAARAAVLDFGAKTGKLSVDDIDFVKSRAFFDPVSFDKHYGRIAGACLKGSGSPFFEKVNPAQFSVEDIDKRLRLDRAAERARRKAAGGDGNKEMEGAAGRGRNREDRQAGNNAAGRIWGNREGRNRENRKTGGSGKSIKLSKAEEKLLWERPLSAGEKALLQELKRMKEGKRIAAKGRPHHGIRKAGDLVGMGWRYLQRMDDSAVEGARQFLDLYQGGRGTVLVAGGSYRAGRKAVRFMGRGAVRLAHTKPVRFVGYRFKAAGRVAASAVKRTRPVQGMIRAGQRGKAVAGDVRKSARNIRRTAGRAVRGSRPVRVVSGSPAAASLREMAQAAKEKAQKAGRKVRRTGSNVYRKSRRAGRKVKNGAGKVGRAVRKPIDLVLKPFHQLAQAFNTLKEFFWKKLLLPLAAGAGVMVVLYTLLIAMFSFLYGLGKTAGEASMSLLGIRKAEDVGEWVEFLNGKADAVCLEAVEAAKGAPVSGTVYDGVRLYAYGSPKSAGDETAGYYHRGEAVDPAKLNGWHIIYLDSDGNVIGNNTSNTKDIISLVSVMMDNSMENSSEVMDFLGDMWEGMKPVLTLCESDIYHTEYSTDTFPFDGGDYYCTDGGFYSHYASAAAEGVVMYEEAAEAHLEDAGDAGDTGDADHGGYICSGKGCEYTEWDEWVLTCSKEEHSHSGACRISGHMDSGDVTCVDPAHCTEESHYGEQDCGREEHTHSVEDGCYRHDIHRDYYCPGHAALHCSYGYRDINVYVTLLDKEDFFKADIDSSRAVMAYKKPVGYQGTACSSFGIIDSFGTGGSFENIDGSADGDSPGIVEDGSFGSAGIGFEECTAVVQFKTCFDGYRKRMKEFVNNRFWDYGEHLLHAVYNPENGCVECALNHLGGAYTLENSEVDPADKCVGAIEWVNRIYDTDWFELYAVDVDSFDGGIAVGGTLSAEEQAEIQDAICLRYGDISAARQALINTALGQVGVIRYYWGGKPVNAGMPLTVSLNGAGTAVVGSSCTADRKGRAVAGLDCSGFVGWAYWTAFGVKPGMSTGTFTDSLGLEQIGFGDLQPGDIGLQAVPGAASNHIGIFLGLDGNGKALWVHCSGSSGVVVNNTNGFRLYYRLM